MTTSTSWRRCTKRIGNRERLNLNLMQSNEDIGIRLGVSFDVDTLSRLARIRLGSTRLASSAGGNYPEDYAEFVATSHTTMSTKLCFLQHVSRLHPCSMIRICGSKQCDRDPSDVVWPRLILPFCVLSNLLCLTYVKFQV